MPHPHKLSEAQILDEAVRMVDELGLAGLSTRLLADHLGARAPSLYRYFPDKERLICALGARFRDELTAALAPHQTLTGLARAYWAYALHHPLRYDLLVRHSPDEAHGPDGFAPTLVPLLAVAGRLNPDCAVPIARAIWSYLHGAVTLRLAWSATDGLDPEDAFELGLHALERGLSLART